MWIELRNRILTVLAHSRRQFLARLGASTIGVRAIVIDSKDRILLVRHTYMTGWYLPGGGLKQGETPQQALRRELEEEVGLTPTAPPELFGVYFNPFNGGSDFPVVFVVRVFTSLPVTSPEIAEQGWFA